MEVNTKKILGIKEKSPTNLMRTIKEIIGAKSFLMHRNKIIFDNKLAISYEEVDSEFVSKRIEFI